MSSSVCLYVCVCFREEKKKEACGQDHHITAAQKKVSGPRTAHQWVSPSRDAASQLFISLRVPNEQNQKEGKGDIRRDGGKGVAVAVPPATPRSTDPPLRTRKTQRLDMEDQTVD